MWRELSTAHVIISDGRLDKYWEKGHVKKPGQIYIQARYAGLGPVKGGIDVHNINAQVLDKITRDSHQLDFLVSNSRYGTELYRGNFRFGGEILEIGTPRDDVLLSSDRSRALRAVREKYGISTSQKIALYAPAHRPWTKARFPRPDYDKVLSALQKRFGGDWLLLIRRDPHLNERGMHWLLPKDIPDVMDAWDYPDTTELLIASDVTIGDYSSCTFDFLLTGRPTFFYTPDAAIYEEKVGFYEQLKDIDLFGSKTNKELLSSIASFSPEKYCESVRNYLTKRRYVNSRSSEKICNKILKITEEPLPEFCAFRKNMSNKIRQRIWTAVYHASNLNIDFRQHRLFGVKFTTLRNPSPPANQYADVPIEDNKIFFLPALPGYGGNSKYIVEEIIRRKLPYQLVWCIPPHDKTFLKNLDIFPAQLRLVLRHTEEFRRELSSSKVLICAIQRMGLYREGFVKRNEQIYVQIWHGSFGIKANPMDPIKLLWSRLAEQELDYLVANSSFEAETIYPPLFCFNRDIKSRIRLLGNARNDLFFSKGQEVIQSKVKKALKIGNEKKLVLYAPTWRDDGDIAWDTLDTKTLCVALTAQFGGEWVCAVRVHPMMRARRAYNSLTIDASEYPDMQELLAASDVLVSDYSSCVCDFMLTLRPIFFYVPDYKQYKSKTRGLLYPLEDTPCPIAKNNDELLWEIQDFTLDKYQVNLNRFIEKMGSVEDGYAAARIVDLIENIAPVRKGKD